MKYNVGDKVRVRQWDDMVKEYGLLGDAKSDICIPGFTNGMKKFCGSVVTISNIIFNDSGYLIKEDNQNWYWIDKMLEPYKVKIARQADLIDKEVFSKMVEQLKEQPIIFVPKI